MPSLFFASLFLLLPQLNAASGNCCASVPISAEAKEKRGKSKA
jgi:hypothetical protein